jgi:hypothetical protein
MLVIVLAFGSALDAAAQASRHKPKSKKPKASPCRTGCKPDISAPAVATETPEDEASQKELAELAREVHSGSPAAYQKLSAFAAKNTTNVWGARAALALGYEDYSKNRTAQALGWLIKAQNDRLLREYALYWTAQAQRGLDETPRPTMFFKRFSATIRIRRCASHCWRPSRRLLFRLGMRKKPLTP